MIKLDRSLLAEMTESEDKMNFISSIVYACHRFGKKVCMEGWRPMCRTISSRRPAAT